MPVHGDDDEEPPFKTLTPEQQAALDARVAKQSGPLGDGNLRAGKYNMRLVNQAIRNGWNVPQEVKARVVKQMSKIVSQSEEERNKIAAAKVLVSADSVDVAREKMEQPQAGTTVNVAVVNQIQVNETDDWYGTKAARRDVAAGDGSPAIGNPVAGPIQSGGLRPPVGQNGVGTNGHTQGPRSGEGPTPGRD